MPQQHLPDHPDLTPLRREAKSLRDRVRDADPEAITTVHEHHPAPRIAPEDEPGGTGFRLADAQLTVARSYGFRSWPALRRHVDQVHRLTRRPHLAAACTGTDELLRLACLDYGTDRRSDREEAARRLAADPALAGASLCTAAAFGDLAAARAILAVDPGAVSREDGPFRWPPLLYLAYSRTCISAPGADGAGHLAVARLLITHGADPNAGFLWDGMTSPFTALTGAFGGGEQAAPPHPDELPLARLLLGAGAEPNDNQTIYNRGAGDRLVRDDTEFLELLLAAGLGRGDGGPWHRLLAPRHPAPTQIVADALQHAAEKGLPRRLTLLLEHGVDPDRGSTHPLHHGRTPYEGAVLHGNAAAVELLAAAGADTSGAGPLEQLVGACLSGDRDAALRAAADDALLRTLLTRHRDLVARAAVLGRPNAVRLCLDLGSDIDALTGTTALHEAAVRGEESVVELLLELGADPGILDASHRAPAAAWARHGGHDRLAERLDTVAGRAVP
ncbi:ankyrin repeat domain-containing protein [Brachybacterium sp. FME24]|uniref:ankyrin repeat domain-containing protein n=1 Tax=Brachybacterium sp. FME24 TaxID=2742605 RepID=UPI0018684C6C|nr:ankyrin repeat domain-containing protein [Brachybacterium sp. FME24]